MSQVIKILRDAFEAVDLPLFLLAYNVVPNRTGDDLAQGGILEVGAVFCSMMAWITRIS